MIVQEMMKTDVVTLHKEATIETAWKLIRKHRIRHIPIIEEDRTLIGIISDRDLRDATPSIFHENRNLEELQKPVSEIMVTDVITAHPLDFVEELSTVFYEHEIACIPILEKKKLVGIITERDMLYTLIQLTGALQPSSHLEVKVKNIAGQLAEVASLIKHHKTNINSVLVYPSKQENYKILVLRINTINPQKIVTELKNAGYDVLWPKEAEVQQ
ncbi:acetoin utilization AcuB family protein [Fictibacillus sp. Mic-4]|uniref:acetoin utilization AcuB family protein n=1 Tax=Fictibacillus TaxID=1329200 RepID=UPI0004064F13|nr:acetoin utilization AcuB family protein [Fictibacillus gelatini]